MPYTEEEQKKIDALAANAPPVPADFRARQYDNPHKLDYETLRVVQWPYYYAEMVFSNYQSLVKSQSK